jgi:hypothetical protein
VFLVIYARWNVHQLFPVAARVIVFDVRDSHHRAGRLRTPWTGPRLSALSAGDGGVFGHQDRERQIERLDVDPKSHEMLNPVGAASCSTTCVVPKFRSAGIPSTFSLHFSLAKGFFVCIALTGARRAMVACWRAIDEI